jgi:hypothetical protein
MKYHKLITKISTLIICVATLPLIQSCNNTAEDQVLQSSQTEYLDVDVSNLQNLTEEQKTILEKAKARLDPYVTYNDHAYSLNVKQASDVQMSKRLFEFEKATIKHTNTLIQNLNVVIDKNNPRILHVVTIRTLNSNKRLKVLGYESTPTNGQNSWNVDWSGVNIYLNNETTKKLISAIKSGQSDATIAGIITGACGQPEGAAMAAVIAWACNKLATEYENANNGQGVVISYGWWGSVQSR